jgi:metal-dependent hydrolase (beta-lactamase superfamily II)
MKDNSREENLKIIIKLQALGIKKVIPLHCTGLAARRLFRTAYRKDFGALREGASLTMQGPPPPPGIPFLTISEG